MTRNLNYLGSKHTLSNKILSCIQEQIPDLSSKSFCDLFAGSGIIGEKMQEHTSKIVSNDLELYSYIINSALLKQCYTQKIQQIIDYCNNIIEPVSGLITKHYAIDRKHFTMSNAQKCDGIRLCLEELYSGSEIDKYEYHFLLASLVSSMDRCANTTSIYSAYLKDYKKDALKDLTIKPIHTNTHVKVGLNEVYNDYAENIQVNTDIVYLDPPYNHRQYGGYYGFLNYLVMYDENIKVYGKGGLIPNYNKSDFCYKQKVQKAFETIIHNTRNCSYIVLSYSSESILSLDDLKKLFRGKEIILNELEYKNYKSNHQTDMRRVVEYLIIIK